MVKAAPRGIDILMAKSPTYKQSAYSFLSCFSHLLLERFLLQELYALGGAWNPGSGMCQSRGNWLLLGTVIRCDEETFYNHLVL